MRVPVLIVGAGLSGLSTAAFLGLHGVPALVVERHATTSQHPKARGQMPHTMEALGLLGLADTFVEHSPRSTGFRIRMAESARGPVFREIARDTYFDLGHLTPARAADVSQERAEPLLATRARELGATVRFSTQLESLTQDENGVTAELTDLVTGEHYTVEADYAVGADGHRSPVRGILDIGTHGYGSMGSSVHWLIRADLSHVVGDEQVLYYLQNPRLCGGTGVVASTDYPDRFVITADYDPETQTLADFDDPVNIEHIRTATGVPDLEPEIIESSTTTASMTIADRFGIGRVHLVGDAAHTMPPQGGMGGNTAVMDGFYLAWKLAAAAKGYAGQALLDSHDVERRPVGELVAKNQYLNALIRTPSGPEVQPDGEPIEDPGLLFFGYRHNGAVVREPDDAGELLEEPTEPTGRPGSRAPHVRLTGPTGPLSTIDLYGLGFVLLTGSSSWSDAADVAEVELGIPLTAYRIGNGQRYSGDWTSPYGVTQDGAVLVRPDRFIAWRSTGAGKPADLINALRTVLGREPDPDSVHSRSTQRTRAGAPQGR